MSGIIAASGGIYHSLALKNDGTVWAWGYNNYGQLGDGTTIDRSTPVQVTGLSGIKAISAGGYHNLALKEDGTVWAWGYNGYGQLGDGTTVNRSTPVQVTGLNGIIEIAAGGTHIGMGGGAHSVALKNDGTVWTWGYNGYGQLGDGTTTNRSTAVQATGLNNIMAIAVGCSHTLAIKNDGTVWTFGWNGQGQLGDSTMTNRGSAVQAIGLNGITAAAAGCYHTIILKNDGTVWTCGDNGFWQVGNDLSAYGNFFPKYIYGNTSGIAITAFDPASLNLSWLPIGGALSYDIQRDGRKAFSVKGTSMTDTGLKPNRQYTYRVRSVSADGFGEWSNPVSKYTLANVPVKKGVSAAKNGGIKASWSAGGNPIGTQYALAAFDAGGTPVVQNNWTASLSDTITGLSPSASYGMKVKARNQEGIETGWRELGIAMPAPAAPTVTAQPSHGTYTEITWPAVSGAVWYDVEADGKVIEKASLTKDINNIYTYKNSGLKPLSQHSYRVRARNISGAGDWSPILTVMTSSGIPVTAPVISPDPPRATNTSVILTWGEVIDAEAYDVVEVVGGQETQVTDNGPGATCEKRGLAPGSTHTYKVRAKNSMADGPWSGQATVTTFLLGTPSNITYVESDTSITFAWDPVTGATSYTIDIDGVPVTGITDTTYTKAGLSEDTKITYSVKAVNVSGESAWGVEAPAWTLPSKPAMPLNVNATVSDASITVTWDEVHHSDNSDLEDPEGYDVELDGVVLENGVVPVYIHNELEPYTLHTYRVRARNLSVEGDWSPLQSIRTLPGKPKAPGGILVKSTQTGAAISWSPEPGATGYNIQVNDGMSTIEEYNLQKASYTHRRTGVGKECKYRIRTRNEEGISEWGGLIVNNAIKTDCKKKENVDLGLTATDIIDFSPYTMVVTYNPGVIEVVDLCTLSGRLETSAGKVEGTEIEILEYTPGRIVFKVNKVVNPGEAWTGVVNSIKFKAVETGGTTITYTVLCESGQ